LLSLLLIFFVYIVFNYQYYFFYYTRLTYGIFEYTTLTSDSRYISNHKWYTCNTVYVWRYGLRINLFLSFRPVNSFNVIIEQLVSLK